MEKVIDFLKEIIITILIGLLGSIIGNMIGFLESDCTLPIVVGMVAGVIINRCYKILKKSE